jgi:hypothetical protein
MRPGLYLYMSLVCSGLICGALPAFAGDNPAQQGAQATPTAQSSSTTTTTSTTASQEPTTSTTKPASNAAPAQSDKRDELTPDEKRLLSAGYHLHVENGQKVFCRREAQLGSHFEHKVCGTAEQLAAARQTSREVLENTQRPGANPTGH